MTEFLLPVRTEIDMRAYRKYMNHSHKFLESMDIEYSKMTERGRFVLDSSIVVLTVFILYWIVYYLGLFVYSLYISIFGHTLLPIPVALISPVLLWVWRSWKSYKEIT